MACFPISPWSNSVSSKMYLSMGEHRSQTLREIDITFCRNTTYNGTFPLRDRLSNLKLIRQPKWLDGQFHTPFGDSPSYSQVEVHTYWADGKFQSRYMD